MKIIELRDVTVSYRENVALKNVSLAIEEGTHLAVIGPNGAGKTTLLTAINGLGKILNGQVFVFGQKFTSKNACQIRQEIGYLPQNLNIDARSPISVYEVVMMGRIAKIGLFKYPDSDDKKIVQEAMRLCGIEELNKRPIGHLSGGEQQKVFIAKALAQKPRILFLDEPTANLDLKAQKEIIELINNIYKETKITILLVTHILGHIPQTANQGCLMKEGRILFSGPIEEALSCELLSKVYACPIKPKEQLTYA